MDLSFLYGGHEWHTTERIKYYFIFPSAQPLALIEIQQKRLTFIFHSFLSIARLDVQFNRTQCFSSRDSEWTTDTTSSRQTWTQSREVYLNWFYTGQWAQEHIGLKIKSSVWAAAQWHSTDSPYRSWWQLYIWWFFVVPLPSTDSVRTRSVDTMVLLLLLILVGLSPIEWMFWVRPNFLSLWQIF